MSTESQNIVQPKLCLDTATGLMTRARQLSSPNYDDRPPEAEIEALIVHAISLPPGQYGGNYVEQFFCNELVKEEHSYFPEISDVQVSAHFYIRRNGDLIQFVPINKRAWHAGKSICMGREAVNDFSIGIELEGCDDDTFETAQYQTLIELTQILIAAVPALTEQHIYGHEDIAPGRKTDPGPGFDWPAFRLALSAQKLQVAVKDGGSL